MNTSENQSKEYDWELIAKNASKHFMDIFIMPEVVRRQEIGELPKPLDLRAAQIVFYPDGKNPTVRINSEVKAVAKMKLKAGIEKNFGDPVFSNELDGLEELTLSNKDSPDCGHVTLLKLNGTWMMAFDFIYNKALAKKTIETAKEFIEAAEFSFSRHHWSAFADNLFSAAELLAKATLLATWPDPKFREKTTHSAIHSRYNRFAHLGNINPTHADTFNKLSIMRYPARYSKEEFALSENEGQSLIQGIQSMLDETNLIARVNRKIE
ncbi:MAG: HEPN domain-containing protein [Candidatus Brocadiaceae bacterium]|nr:HEPN domain-containing protein [Candidatus Brocadiaceae bacterium]